MKKILFFLFLLLFLLILFFFLVQCASFLTIKKNEQPTLEMTQELQLLLDSVFYEREFEKYVFDCSNRTAFLYDFLTARGYDCQIMTGTNTLLFFLPKYHDRNHAWLLVGKNGKKFFVNPSFKRVAEPDEFKEYPLRWRFRSLKSAKRLFEFLGFPHEWDY